MGSIDLQPLDLSQHGIDVQIDEPIGFAWESRVYKGRDERVYKVYQYAKAPAYRRVALEQVQRYQEITARASAVSNKILNPSELNGKVIWDVVTIDGVGQVDDDGIVVPCAVSMYVDGPNMRESEKEVALFLFTYEYSTPIAEWLDDITKQYRKLTGERAIRIIPDNVKPEFREDSCIMRITDVCAEVKAIHS